MSAQLLLTRPAEAAARFAKQARAAGWLGPILCAPLMRIVLAPPDPQALQQAGSLIFTSRHGVAAVQAVGAGDRLARDLPVACVGPGTAQAARAAGFATILQPAGGDARALLQMLRDRPLPEPILHLRGDHAAMALADELQRAGIAAQQCICYSQDALPLSVQAHNLLRGPDPLVLPVFSPRSAQLLLTALAAAPGLAAPLHLVAISEACAKVLLTAETNVTLASLTVAAQPDGDAILKEILAAQRKLVEAGKPL